MSGHGGYLFFVWLHILAAALWVGGMLFFVLVLLPLSRSERYRALAPELVQLSGLRFRTVGWTALILLIVTGTLALLYRGLGSLLGEAAFWHAPFGSVLAMKLFLVAVVLGISAVHDFYVGPRSVARWQQAPDAPGTRRLRRLAAWMGRLNLLLSLAIVFLAVALVRGLP